MPIKLHNKLLNLNKHERFRRYIIPILSNFVGTQPRPLKRLRTIAPFGSFVFALLFSAAFSVILDALPSYAASISMTITSSAEQSFDVLPTGSGTTFKESSPILVTLSSTAADVAEAPWGYTLTIAGTDSNGYLNGSGNNKLESITSTTGIDSTGISAGEWGLKYCKTSDDADCMKVAKYVSGPNTSNANLVQIDQTERSTTESATYALAIGVAADADTPKDTYTSDFVLAATINAIGYSIGFVDPLGNMPDTMSSTTTGANITIPDQTPTRTGYTFVGWCRTVPVGNLCGDKTTPDYIPGSSYSLSSGAITNLYAMWKATNSFAKAFSEYGASQVTINGNSYYKLQDMITPICKSVSVTGEDSIIELADTRDNQIYKVAKLVDGSCWMLDNLALGSDAEIALTPDDTNVVSNWTLPASDVTCLTESVCQGDKTGYEVAAIYAGDKNAVPSDSISQAGGYKAGVYYNYCAVSAGTICNNPSVDNSSYDFSHDVCPKGWRLPTGGGSGEYQTLYSALGGPRIYGFSTIAYTELRYALHLPLSGGCFLNGPYNLNIGNYTWSSTRVDNVGMIRLTLDASGGVDTTRYWNQRAGGQTVRCIAK